MLILGLKGLTIIPRARVGGLGRSAEWLQLPHMQ